MVWELSDGFEQAKYSTVVNDIVNDSVIGVVIFINSINDVVSGIDGAAGNGTDRTKRPVSPGF